MASVAATAGVAAQHDGQHSKTRRLFCPTSKARRTKIYLFPKRRSYDLTKPARASQEGRFANATTRGAGCDGGVGPQGGRRNRVGSSRVVLPPRCWGQANRVIWSRRRLTSPDSEESAE